MGPLDCLRRYPLFDLLTPAQLGAWLKRGQELTAATGETLFQEGSAGTWAYLVLDGRVRVLRRAPGGREISLGQFGPGEVFGEYALLPPHRNTATCRAAGPARLLALPLLPPLSVLATLPGVASHFKNWLRLHGLVSYLRDRVFLGFMSAPSALKFLDRLRPVTFRALRTVQAEGLGDDGWYFIQSGQVSLQPAAAEPASPLRELGPGDAFGARALLDGAGLPVAVALTETRCLCLSRADFDGTAGQSQHSLSQSLQPHQPSLCLKYVWVGQQEAADCGVACLAMVARAYGLPVCAETLLKSVRRDPNGASLAELQRAALSLGLRPVPVRVSPEQFGQVALPAIAHYQSGHYVVLYEFGPEGVVVGDPAAGMVRLSRDLFVRSCSGNLLLVRPQPVDRQAPSSRADEPGSRFPD